MPSVFSPHELLLYRGLCSMYSGEPLAATADFEASLEIARQLRSAALTAAAIEGVGETNNVDAISARSTMQLSAAGKATMAKQAPEVASQLGLDCFECEILYNVVLCYLMAKDYRAANEICQRLLLHT